jgi:hypothetical protein
LLLSIEEHSMSTNTSAELDVFDCNLGEGGLEEFEPEAQAGSVWTPSVAPARDRTWLFAVPVALAAALLGAAVSWVGTRPGPVATARQAPAPTASALPAASSPLREVPPIPAVATRPLAAAPPAAVALPQPEPAPLDAALEPTLTAISRAYRTLDAASLTAVWPGADLAALSESFSDLKYQALTFDRCRLQPTGRDAAVATCEVSIASASKGGDEALQRRRESWTLALGRSDDQWTIAGLTVR